MILQVPCGDPQRIPLIRPSHGDKLTSYVLQDTMTVTLSLTRGAPAMETEEYRFHEDSVCMRRSVVICCAT